MRHLRNRIAPDSKGFTLIELVVVISILGILAAIAVPAITSYLGSAKERAYHADRDRIQLAVDAYLSHPANERFVGRRQYPTFAKQNAGTASAILKADVPTGTAVTGLGVADSNPAGGTQGGDPSWEDKDGDGLRNTTGEELWAETATPTGEHWNTSDVSRGSTDYVVDSRDWFIDFGELVVAGLLDEVPASASRDNDNGADGSYSWYVDANGRAESFFYFFPTSANKGYQEVYP